VSPKFEGLTLVKRQRLVYSVSRVVGWCVGMGCLCAHVCVGVRVWGHPRVYVCAGVGMGMYAFMSCDAHCLGS